MASILDMHASSDSEDDDYVPPEISKSRLASDSSYDEELVSDDEILNSGGCNGKKTETRKEQQADVKIAETDSVAKVDEKQRAKELWETFLNDVESVTPPKKSSPAAFSSHSSSVKLSRNCETESPKKDTKPVDKVFEFAGETVTFVKDVNSCVTVGEEQNNSQPIPMERPPCIPKKRGIDSVLGTIVNKNRKLTVLEKSKLDWATFKKDEGLENELEKFNKGKQGFIERQRFLQRSDVRSFEMEKTMRQTLQKK